MREGGGEDADAKHGRKGGKEGRNEGRKEGKTTKKKRRQKDQLHTPSDMQKIQRLFIRDSDHVQFEGSSSFP